LPAVKTQALTMNKRIIAMAAEGKLSPLNSAFCPGPLEKLFKKWPQRFPS
jgi:hypothetical protein